MAGNHDAAAPKGLAIYVGDLEYSYSDLLDAEPGDEMTISIDRDGWAYFEYADEGANPDFIVPEGDEEARIAAAEAAIVVKYPDYMT